MEPTTLLPIIAVLSLVSVEYGGWALLGFLTGRGRLGGIRERFFRAGQSSLGTVVTRSGAILIGVALIMLVAGLLTGS